MDSRTSHLVHNPYSLKGDVPVENIAASPSAIRGAADLGTFGSAALVGAGGLSAELLTRMSKRYSRQNQRGSAAPPPRAMIPHSETSLSTISSVPSSGDPSGFSAESSSISGPATSAGFSCDLNDYPVDFQQLPTAVWFPEGHLSTHQDAYYFSPLPNWGWYWTSPIPWPPLSCETCACPYEMTNPQRPDSPVPQGFDPVLSARSDDMTSDEPKQGSDTVAAAALPKGLMISAPRGLTPAQRYQWRRKVAAEAPCDHFTSWRRLRTRRRMDQMFCSMCEAKWRICNRNMMMPAQPTASSPAQQQHG